MRKREVSLVAAGLVLLVLSAGRLAAKPASPSDVTIKNVRAGLVCGPGKDELRVCFRANAIPITGESTCVFGGSNRPCTWYGFSFDYEAPSAGTVLQCENMSDHAGDVGNAESVTKKQERSQYELVLPEAKGHFFNPQYSVLPKLDRMFGATIHLRNRCSYLGRLLFEVSFDLKFPER